MANILEEVEIIEGQDSRILQITDKSAQSKIGTLNELATTNKATLVDAINETYNYTKHIDDDKVIPLQTALQNEITARTNADNSLQASINSEAGTRYNQDNYILGLLQQTNVGSYSNIVTVGAHGCNYLTISEAITAVKTYATPNNRVAIIVVGGTYNEELDLTGNCGIDLIGVGMPKIVYSSVYPNAPINCDGQIYISGFYLINNNASGNAYAMHYEGQSVEASNCDVYVHNCILVSNSNSALGFGCGVGTTGRFENCYFVTNNSNVSPLYLHNRPQGSSALQSLEFVSCVMRSAGNFALLVDNSRAMASADTTSPLRLTFVGCSAGAGHELVNYRDTSNHYQRFIPNIGEICVSVNSINNDILGVNYNEQEYTLTRSIVMPYHSDTTGDYIRCDFIVPFLATKYYRRIDSVQCNGVDVTDSFAVESGNIDSNRVGLVTTASNVKGRYVTVTMSFSLDSTFA